MADIIRRPTIGPTKSTNEAGDRLDAAVPNPDDWCIVGNIEHIKSSKLYPISAADVMFMSAVIGDNCTMLPIPFDQLAPTFGMGPDGTLVQLRWFYSDGPYGPDELAPTFGMGPDGTLEQLRWFYSDGPYGPDELAPTFGMGPDGTLEQMLNIIDADSPDEELQLSATIKNTCTMDLI